MNTRAGPPRGGIVLVLFLAAGAAAAQDPGPAPARRIIFGGDAATPPFEYLEQGEPRGFNVELLRALAREMDAQVVFRLGPWAEILREFEAGNVDVMAMGYSDTRAERYDLLAEIWTLHQVVVFLPGRQAYPRSAEEIGNETVAVAERSRTHDELNRLPEAQRPKFRFARTVGDSISVLARGEATAAGGNGLTLRHAAADLGVRNLVEVPIASVPYMLSARKGKAAEYAWIAAGVARLRETGELARLVEHQLTLRSPAAGWTDFAAPLAGLLAFVLVVAGGTVVWNRSLRRQVAARTSELARLLQEKDRLSRAMVESEGRYRTLVESIHAILWRADARTLHPSFVSKEAEAMLGHPLDRWTSQPGFWVEQMHPDDRPAAYAACAEAAREKRPRVFECRVTAADGHLVWLRGTVHAVEEDGETRELTGVMVDVTEGKRLEEQLRQSQKLEAVGRLAGGVAHDFNNLLTAIAGYAQILMRKLGEGHPVQQKAEAIITAVDRAARLTGQLLAFSRRQVVAPRLLDLNAVVAGFESMLQRVIGEDIRLVTILGRGLLCIKADPGQVEQVLMNLVVNARDAMPKGGTLTIETGLAERSADGAVAPCVLLSVRDTGLGMDAETRSHIFEPFFSTKGPGRGTGLGLATVYGIVQQSQGHIAVETAPGEGSTFRVYLPLAEGQPPVEEAPGRVPDPAGGTETILLVEDEDAVRELTREVLDAGGYVVLEARNGPDALELAGAHPGAIDLLLADVIMPRMSGRELAERLKTLRPETKVLFVSGYTDDAVLRHGVLQDEVPFLQKPYAPQDLEQKVREVLGPRECRH
jgi:PAS domain S-box-containing protein